MSSWSNREIEIKLQVVTDKSYNSICKVVESSVEKLYPSYDVEDDQIIGNAMDIYWDAPKDGIGDFVRLRKTAKGGQITIKSTDKGTNLDRVEIDLEVSDYKQAKTLMFALFGEPKAKVTKKYSVYFLENEHTNISVYQIKNDERIFIEVEGRTKTRVKEIVKGLLDKSDGALECKWIQSSIYDIFVCGKKPKEANIKEFVG